MKPKVKSSSAGATQVATATDRAQVSPAKPTFTRPSAGVSRRSVASKSKNTNLGMLHQSQALKASAADKARDRSETGGGGGTSRTLAGHKVEVSGVEQSTPVTSVRSRDGEFAGRKAGFLKQGRVFVLGKGKEPLMPCHPARARALLKSGKAVIHRHFPFVVRLKHRLSGRGSHQRTRLTADGFPRGYMLRQKNHCGFRTGDLVRASVPKGKRKGHYFGRVAVRAS
ncbi:MAG: RRXRR domain-containing protein, partial [Opitutaceae bacterium]